MPSVPDAGWRGDPDGGRFTPGGRAAQRAGLLAWAEALARSTDEQLAGLLRERSDLRGHARGGFLALAEAATAPSSAATHFERLDRAARQLLEALCVLPHPAGVDELAAALATSPAGLDGVLARLERAGMVLLEGDHVVVNPGMQQASRYPARLGRSAESLLAGRNLHELGDIWQRLNAVRDEPWEKPSGKRDLLASVAASLRDPQLLRSALSAAPAGARELAERIAQGEGPVLQLPYSTYDRSSSEQSAIGWLLRRALVVHTSWGIAEMPAEAGIALRGGVIFPRFSATEPALQASEVDPARVEDAASHAALALVADVTSAVRALGEVPAKLLRDGGLGVREVRRIAKLTGREEPVAARLLELAGAAGLLGYEPEERAVVPTPRFDQFLGQRAAGRWRSLATAWLAAPLELSLAGAPDAEGKPLPPLGMHAPDSGALLRRLLVIDQLAESGPGVAVSPASVAERASWRSPATMGGGPVAPAALASSILGEAELLGISALGALSSFGAALAAGDAGSAEERLAALAPAPAEEIVLQADLTAVVSGEAPEELASELELLADVESSGAATVYRFSEASLRRAFDAGRSAADVLGLLESRAPRGVPQSLTYLVEDLGRRFGRLRAGVATSYVRSDDTALVAELAASKRLKRLGLHAIAPTVLVSQSERDDVLETLRQAGYLAAAEDAGGTLSVRRRRAARATRAPWAVHTEELPAALERRFAAAPKGGGASGPGAKGPGASGPGAKGPGTSSRQREEDGDVAAIVAALRASSTAADGGRLHPLPAFGEMPAERGGRQPPESLCRPGEIARSPQEIVRLLRLAERQDWAVRVGVVAGGHRPASETDALVVTTSQRHVVLELVPDGNSAVYELSDLSWARVLTEAEEDARVMPPW